jgi:hypothetical protein
MEPINLYKRVKAKVSPLRSKERRCISAQTRSPDPNHKPIQKNWLEALMGIREKSGKPLFLKKRCYSPVLE